MTGMIAKDPTHINFKTTPEGAEWLDRMTDRHDVSRTELIRCALRLAARHPDELVDIINARIDARK